MKTVVMVSSETESDHNDDTGDPRGQEMPTVRAWRKQRCTLALKQQHTTWSAQRDSYVASYWGTWGGSVCLLAALNAEVGMENQSQWATCIHMLRSCESQATRVVMIRI